MTQVTARVKKRNYIVANIRENIVNIRPKSKSIARKYIKPYLYVNAGALLALCIDALFRQTNPLYRKLLRRVFGYHYEPNVMFNAVLLFALLLLTAAAVTYFKPMNRKGALVSGFGVVVFVYFLIG